MIELFECERVGFQNFHQNYFVRSSLLNSWNFSDSFGLTVGTFNLNLEGRTYTANSVLFERTRGWDQILASLSLRFALQCPIHSPGIALHDLIEQPILIETDND